MVKKRKTLGEDHFQSRFNVEVKDLGMKTKGDDRRLVNDWDHSDWYDSTIYNGILNRRDGNFQLQMQWVDVNNDGHKIVLPHQVVEAIIRAYQSVLKQSKSSRASKAYRTRLENGTVPPEFLPKGVRVE